MAGADPVVILGLTEGGITAEQKLVDLLPPLVAPTAATEHNTIRTPLVPFACWRAHDMRFEFASSFVLPSISPEIRSLKELIDRRTLTNDKGELTDKPVLSVFGHADPVGDDNFNKQLSGRRAQAIYGMLVRNVDLWDDLFSHPLGDDNWQTKPLQTIHETLKTPAGATPPNAPVRQALFKAYMDEICTVRDESGKPILDSAGQPVRLELKATDFLAGGADKGFKGDFQGCSEFNPVMIFSEKENKEFADPKRKAARDEENTPNRRVVIYFYRPKTHITPGAWPCPRAKEGVEECKKRFWSDGEKRRSTRLPDERREYEKTKDTFACRFYDRMATFSPCERFRPGNGIFHMQCLSGDGTLVLAKRKYTIRGKGNPSFQFTGTLDDTGTLRHKAVPAGDYVLTVQRCGEDTAIAVLRSTETVPQIRMLENARLAIHVLTPAGDPIADATVEVDGIGKRLTDADGVAYFNTVAEGEVTFKVSKPGLEPVKARASQRASLVGDPVRDTPDDGTVTGKTTVKDSRTDTVVNLTPKAKPAKLLRIEARQAGTRSRRNAKAEGLPENTLTPSSSSDTDLGKNVPVVIIRGSRPVFLKAITDPPGQLVTWEVTPNQSQGAVPDIDPKQTTGDFEAQVQTDKTGSFSVTAKLGATAIVWNLVIVGVDVDTTSTFKTRSDLLTDLLEFAETPEGKKTLTPDAVGKLLENKTQVTGVASGHFEFGKHAWSSEVRVTLKGGGPSGTLGCDQVSVHILQNVVAEGTRGLYQTKIAFTEVPVPLLDTPQGSPPGYDGPTIGGGLSGGRPVLQCPFLHGDGMFKLTKNDPTARTMIVGDSPAAGFPTRGKEALDKLERIDRETRFRAAVVSFSKHSKNAVVAHADLFWEIDWTGNVNVSGGTGKWSKDTANVKVTQPWKPIKSSSGIDGTDVANATLEMFKPLATEFNGTEQKKFINRP